MYLCVNRHYSLHTYVLICVRSSTQVPRVKYVIWNKDFSMVALISKHQLVLATKQLDQLCTVTETYATLHITCLCFIDLLYCNVL